MLHTAELVERHRITIKMVDLPSTAAARTDVARLHALAYARRRGVELDERDMNAVSGSSTTRGSAFDGVVFDLHVGHGTIGTDEHDAPAATSASLSKNTENSMSLE